jgi:hypothetical protein
MTAALDHRLDIKAMEPTVFSVAPLSFSHTMAQLLEWIESSNLNVQVERRTWQWTWPRRCRCPSDNCLHYSLTLRFSSPGEALLFRVAWM